MLYQDRSKRTDTHRRNEYHPSRLLIQTQHLHNNICVCAALFKCSLPPLPQVLFRYTHTHTHLAAFPHTEPQHAADYLIDLQSQRHTAAGLATPRNSGIQAQR